MLIESCLSASSLVGAPRGNLEWVASILPQRCPQLALPLVAQLTLQTRGATDFGWRFLLGPLSPCWPCSILRACVCTYGGGGRIAWGRNRPNSTRLQAPQTCVAHVCRAPHRPRSPSYQLCPGSRKINAFVENNTGTVLCGSVSRVHRVQTTGAHAKLTLSKQSVDGACRWSQMASADVSHPNTAPAPFYLVHHLYKY